MSLRLDIRQTFAFRENRFWSTQRAYHSFQVRPYYKLYSKYQATEDGNSVYCPPVFKIKVWLFKAEILCLKEMQRYRYVTTLLLINNNT